MSRDRFQQLTEQGFQALFAGETEQAFALLDLALEAAEACGSELVDKARLNISQALEHDGQLEEAEHGLREILMRSREPNFIYTASITIARVRKGLRDVDRARFYLKRALGAAQEMGDPLREASALTERANLCMNANRFPEAAEDYTHVLELLQSIDTEGHAKAVALDNLGYCLVLDDKVEKGITLLEQAVAEAKTHHVRRVLAEASQDLCFAHLKLDEFTEAQKPGERSLQIAEAEGYEDITKNVLFLLGEVHSRRGEIELARTYYSQLQKYYPGMHDLGAFFNTYDISSMITLKEF